MSEFREVKEIWQAKPATDGAGVKLNRVFGYYEVPKLDPFLLLDDFRSENPDDYIAGFPWHPHRGIETVTYMIHGKVRHEDSIGSNGVIEGGDIQWMSAGSGIVHQEMPEQEKGLLWGFQLWANLPQANKMMKPLYQEYKAKDIPVVDGPHGLKVKVLAGTWNKVTGPVKNVTVKPTYLDAEVPPFAISDWEIDPTHNVFAYVAKGSATFQGKDQPAGEKSLVLFEKGNKIRIIAGQDGVRFLLIAGKPLGEPVAWRGPIVMNTDDELRTAFEEYANGTFLKTE
jgi:quercetin 2,3-dioxygenase